MADSREGRPNSPRWAAESPEMSSAEPAYVVNAGLLLLLNCVHDVPSMSRAASRAGTREGSAKTLLNIMCIIGIARCRQEGLAGAGALASCPDVQVTTAGAMSSLHAARGRRGSPGNRGVLAPLGRARARPVDQR